MSVIEKYSHIHTLKKTIHSPSIGVFRMESPLLTDKTRLRQTSIFQTMPQILQQLPFQLPTVVEPNTLLLKFFTVQLIIIFF